MREHILRHRVTAGDANAPGSFAAPRRAAGEGITPSSSSPPSRAPRFDLQDTLAHVRGDPAIHSRESALPWHVMFERQEQRLAHHARSLGLPTDWQPPARAHSIPGGAEHHLWKGTDGRVYKMTKDDHFGQVPCHNPASGTGWENFAAAPADYLERVTLMNEVFGDDLRVEGLRCGHTIAIVTSQPLRKPARRRQPHPRLIREIGAYMEQRGFVDLGFAAWFHPVKKLMVTDATPDNFIETKHGLQPVDLMITRAQGKLLRMLEKKLASGQPNDELRMQRRSEK